MPLNVSWLVTITMKYHRISNVTPAPENYGYPKVTLNFYIPMAAVSPCLINISVHTEF